MANMAANQRESSEPLETLGSNLRSRRRALGLTLQDVADGANLTAGFISQLERNLTSPSISSLAAIARVLQSDLAEFFTIPGSDSLTTRANQRRNYTLDATRTRYERVSSSFPGHVLNAVIVHEQPGYRSEAIRHEGEELFYVLNGSITVELNGNAVVLKAGDSIHFSSEDQHSTWNHTSEVASILMVVTMDVFGDTAKHGRRTGEDLPVD